MSNLARFAQVVVLAPIDRRPPKTDKPGRMETLVDFDPRRQVFTYGIPRDLRGRIERGMVVEVPFGRGRQLGLVLNLNESAPPEIAVKSLGEPISEGPALTPAQMDLALWMSQHYLAPLSECVRLILPPGFTARRDLWVEYAPGAPIFPDELTPAQQALLLRLKKAPMRLKDLRQTDRRLVSEGVLGELRKQGLVRLVDRGKLKRPKPKLETMLTLVIPPEAIDDTLMRVGRASKQADALRWLAEQGGEAPLAEMRKATGVTKAQVSALAEKGLVRVAKERVALTLPPERASEQVMALRATRKYRAGLQALAQAPDRAMLLPDWRKATGLTLTDARRLAEWRFIEMSEIDVWRDPLAGRVFHSPRPALLTEDQQRAWAAIEAALEEQGARDRWQVEDGTSDLLPLPPPVFLLHGVTGSGKTEIYLRALEKAVAAGRKGIVLVPEISLTPQTIRRFAGRFPGRVAVVHSKLTAGERFDAWRRARSGEVDVVVGSRSALFAPLPDIGLIVVDEEHDPAYKQARTPRYHARDAAVQLARLHGAVTILGSATPSLESQFKARRGVYTLLKLPRRVMGHRERGEIRMAELPPVEIVDMRAELRAGNRSMFSRSLRRALEETLARGEQAIIFLNRRGSATFVMCRDCGHVVRCPRCNVPLTHHWGDVLICHHCNYRQPMSKVCPKCGSHRFKTFGAGTERVMDELRAAFPQARPLRWDRDVTGGKRSHESILQDFIDHKADVLVGTQMIAKGLDLPLVTLVGALSADIGLFLPDFRAAERTFQILMQVAGRAGRSERGGKVIFQTYHPTHYAILAASQHDYDGFYRVEMRYRQEHGYPPYRRLTRMMYLDANRERCQQETARMAAALRRRAEELGLEHVSLIGPAPAFFSKERDKYRWHILIRAEDPAPLLAGVALTPNWRIDVDPVDTL
ncbi:MAG TPA: primosomal protein N' [Anaerolineae bacterium]|nr:primosomal protein N' [Caldilineae bacterium]HID34272.1 primosomal protein N' [Anaerolineae bacterium]